MSQPTFLRVHESALCHDSVNGSDMVRVVRADDSELLAAGNVLAALKALVARTETCDNPSDEGVSSDDDVMIAARAAIAKAEGH